MLLCDSNHIYKNLDTKMSMLEKQMIEARYEFKIGIGKLDERIEKVKSKFKNDIVKLDEKVDKLNKELIVN